MSVVIKTANLKYKNSDGEYVGINAIAEDTIEGKIAAIENAGTTAVNNVISASTNAVNSIISASTAAVNSISTKGAQVLASIPNDYTSLSTKIDNVENMIATSFTTSTTYSANDLVIYNDHYYKFTTAHPAGTWDSAHVAQTTINNEIISNATNLKNQLRDVPITIKHTDEIVPCYWEAGDTITVATKDGNNFTVTRLLLYGIDKVYDAANYYTLSTSQNSRTITLPANKKFYYMSVTGGTEQEIVISNLSQCIMGQVAANTSDIVDTARYAFANHEDAVQAKTEAENVLRIINGEKVTLFTKYVQGKLSLDGTTIVWSSDYKRIATATFIDMTGVDSIDISVAEGYRIYLSWCNANREYIVGRGWFTGEVNKAVEGKYLVYVFASIDDAVPVTPMSFNESMLSISYKYPSKNRVNGIAQYVGYNDDEGVPAYWDTTLNSAISAILNKESDVDAHGDSFVFITDTHWTGNAQHSPALIRKILQETNVKKVFFGGDVLTLYDTQAKALSTGRAFYRAFGDIPVFSSLGNHDVNNNQTTYGSEAYLTYPQVYSYMFKHIEDDVEEMPKWSDTNGDANRNFYYYLDNDTQKIRYIVLNNARARIGTVQKNWLQSKLSEMPTSWTAIIFAHEYWFGLSSDVPIELTYGTDIEESIDEVYDNMNGTVAALIVGHSHYDYSKTSAKGYQIIATATDAYSLSDTSISPTMTLGTDTEQAFDVFSIDTKNKKIYAIRVGAGSSREWSF